MGKISEYPVQTSPASDDLVLGTRDDGTDVSTVNYSIGDILDAYRIPAGSAPASSSSSGEAGAIAYDSTYLYIAVATGTWRRVPLNNWTIGGTYTVSNLTGSRSIDMDTCTINEIKEFLGQLVTDLKTRKYLE